AMVTLWQVSEPATATPFDRHQNVGLHHLAFRVDADALDNLASALANRDDVLIEFAPSALRDGPTRHMMCRIPGNVRVEFIAPVAA
nr:VOC family protein [Gammaproteobacteria bacterium]